MFLLVVEVAAYLASFTMVVRIFEMMGLQIRLMAAAVSGFLRVALCDLAFLLATSTISQIQALALALKQYVKYSYSKNLGAPKLGLTQHIHLGVTPKSAS